MINLPQPYCQSNGTHRGFTLLEVLVSLGILSFGLLGLAMLQLESFKTNTDAYFRTQASLLAYDIMDRIRANATFARTGGYDVPDDSAASTAISQYSSCESSSCDCDASTCTTSDLRDFDLGKWYQGLAALPPDSSQSTVVYDSTNLQYTITIRWREREIRKSREWVLQL